MTLIRCFINVFWYCKHFIIVHIKFYSDKEPPMEWLGGFKKYPSKKIVDAMANNSRKSKKEWLLWMRAGMKSGNVSQVQRQTG